MHREAIQRQLNYHRELIKATGPEYMKTGTYKDIYQKILDGGYSSTNTDKKN